MPQMSQEEQAVREGLDFWEVRVDRGFRAEFQAWSGMDEQEAREQFDAWKSRENVDKVGLFVNGNPENLWIAPREPGRPKERQGHYQRITLEVADEVLTFIDAQGMSRRAYIEQVVREKMEQQ